jgi:hypothetical protein
MVEVPKDFRDFDDDDPEIDKRLSRWKYWQNLKNLKLEFYEETQSKDHREYVDWLENKYGFRPIETNEGMMTDDYTVVDEKKFIVYILKHGN